MSIPSLKKEYEWLTEPPSQCLQQVALDLSGAFLNFFEKRAKYPNFKRKGQKQSIRFPQQVKLSGDYLTLPKLGHKYETKLTLKQKQLSRKQKGSSNRHKARIKVAKVHSKITRCREDFLHKLSRKLVDENQVIVVENLAVKNMVRNSKLAQSISDAGWGQFCTMLN